MARKSHKTGTKCRVVASSALSINIVTSALFSFIWSRYTEMTVGGLIMHEDRAVGHAVLPVVTDAESLCLCAT